MNNVLKRIVLRHTEATSTCTEARFQTMHGCIYILLDCSDACSLALAHKQKSLVGKTRDLENIKDGIYLCCAVA